MKIKMRILMVGIFALSMLFSGIAFANPSEEDSVKAKSWMEKMDARHEALYAELNLSDDQKNALEENKNKNRAEKKMLFESMRANKDLMRQELQKEPLDMQKVSALNSELKELQARMADSRLQGILTVRKILTSQQFKKFLTKMEEHKERRGNQDAGPGVEEKKDVEHLNPGPSGDEK